MRRHLGTLPAALVLVLASTGALAAGPAGADPNPPVPEAADPGAKAAAAGAENRAEQAEAALADVQAMFAGTTASARRVSDESPDLTLALRDLHRLRGSLSGADRAAANAILARPSDGTPGALDEPGYSVPEATPVCGVNVCIHYVTTTANAVSLTDTTPANLIPDYVDQALATFESLHTKYVAAGYRAPKSDDSSVNDGGSAQTDIYLADMPTHYYGYCTSDDPNFPDYPEPKTYDFYDASAFCVVDNNYSSGEYGTSNTPIENLQVTAAHEYFHAVQFAYDYWEDSWLLESTATWVEDEVYDSINDARQYFPDSPLTMPHVSLDWVGNPFSETNPHPTYKYGAWIFFRHFTERFPASVGGLPTFVRDIWRRVDGSAVGADQYSMLAVKNTIVARGAKFAPAFSRFAALNRHPKTSYEEGAAYPATPLAGTFGLTGSRKSTGWYFVKLNHLTNAHARFRPGAGFTQSDWRLRIQVDGPDSVRGSYATVQVYKKNGSIALYPVTLNGFGNITKVFPFSASSVKYVELTMTNASTRYNACYSYATAVQWSCGGTPIDQNLKFLFRGTAYRS